LDVDDYEFYKESFDILDDTFSEWLIEKTEMLSLMIEGQKIIDVGCGSGLLLQYLPKNLILTGADFSEGNIKKAKEKNPHVTFFKANLDDKVSWKNYSNLFDSVLCSEVVEHIKDDKIAMDILFSLVKPNGVLILTVPAFKSLLSKFDIQEGHYRRYSKKDICNLVESAGFHIESARYWNVMGFFGWLVFIKILNLNLKKSSNSIFASIMGKFLKIEKIIKFPFGQTVIIKARKSD
jgi:predicted TPR repeat methyltransferase